jgi:hypothetical protein
MIILNRLYPIKTTSRALRGLLSYLLSTIQVHFKFPVTIAIFTSPMTLVILISRGQASVQL